MAKSRQGGRGGSLRRQVGVRTPKRTFLVFCEGEKTEPAYLKALKREPAVRDVASVDIRVDEGTRGAVPLTLVEVAAKARARFSGEDGEVDEVWCVFDVEWPRNHPNLKRALDLARERGVRVAVSNPCFELWLALHFEDQNAWLDTAAAIRRCRTLDGASGKDLDGVTYMSHRADAARRARALDERHRRDGTDFPRDNPSSGMYRFLDAIEDGEPPSR
ncbi:MAG: RloB family protein [bacterium]|nr:RloB family protein [bacterium]